MTIELARRLLHGGVAPVEELEAALLDAVANDRAWLETLEAGYPMLAELVEHELSRLGLVALDPIRPDVALMDALPPGLCRRLLAVPVGRVRDTGEILVAAADPLDPHIAEELSFHFEVGVVLLRGGCRALRGAIARVEGTVAPPAEPRVYARPLSDPPIPLVRRSIPPPFEAETRPGVAPPAPAQIAIAQDEVGEPVLSLSRSKAPPPLEPALLVVEPPVVEPEPEPATVFETMAVASRPEEIVDLLVDGLGTVATDVAVFAQQGQMYRGRAASVSLGGSERARAALVPASEDSALVRAAVDGSWLGPLSTSEADSTLDEFLGTWGGEVYVVPVVVSGRAALTLVIGRMTATGLATRHADELARAASSALARIVKARKGH